MRPTKPPICHGQRLDERELAALKAIATHNTLAQAASFLGMAKSSVSRVLSDACVKLDADRPSDALLAAWRTGQLQVEICEKPPLPEPLQQMLDMLAAGMTYEQMLKELGCGYSAMATRLGRLYTVLDVSSRVPALYRGIVLGHIPKQPRTPGTNGCPTDPNH